MGARPLLVVGWDGAEPSVVKRLLHKNRLPVLAGLIKSGSFGEITSTQPASSLPAWTSAFTGVAPAKHGMVDFVRKPTGAYRLHLVTASDREVPNLFELASQKNLQVACLGLPGTYPPLVLQGVCIAGFDSPFQRCFDPAAYYPQKLGRDLVQRGLGWPYGALDELRVHDGFHEHALLVLKQTIRQKVRVAKALLERQDFDLFAIHFSESDTAGHHFWAFSDPASPRFRHYPKLGQAIEEIYQELDCALGRLLECFGSQVDLVLLSDHGFRGASDRVVHLNQWLANKGWLRFKSGPWRADRLARWCRELVLSKMPRKVKESLLRTRLADLGFSLDGLARFGAIELGATQVFGDELPQHPGLWIHLEGRDPWGCVPECFAVEWEEKLMQQCRQMVDPVSGEALVEKVICPRQSFSGPFGGRFPDLMLELSAPKGYKLLAAPSPEASGAIVSTLHPQQHIGAKGLGTSGVHAPLGVFLVAGPGFLSQVQLETPHLVDVMPTLGTLLGLKLPPDLDGRLLQVLASGNSLVEEPQEASSLNQPRTSGYTPEEEAVLKKRLEELGYL